MMKTVVYEGENFLGEVEVYFENRNKNNIEIILMKGMKISHYTKESKRCSPLSVLHTITSNGIGAPYFKLMESSNNKTHDFQQEQKSQLFALHANCLNDNKTAVFLHGEQEIHLVAMRSRRTNGVTVTPCFWGFCVMPGLYESCLGLLNLRCLGIVFDLDETLIVANTLRSFEDKIGALLRKISVETDHEKIAGMTAEMKRYQEDKALLKQYAESDQVLENGKVHKIQAEVIPALSDNHQTVVRPLIRLQDKNIVLTRINPKNPDTSVLVRLRPGWKELSNYLSAKGRKRFEVYVCTMAERDYALEMWRLLDPDSNLISSSELLNRIVCVKSGSKKSLLNVFHGGICHPKMALVIDDRLEVWDEKDQPRVHVVPAFAPYYAPQAEANNTIQVLSVARNVACNVRGGFFKDFDESLLQRTSEVFFEDDPKDIALPPDVSNYLVAENKGFGFNGNEELTCFNGMADVELKRRLTEAAISASFPSVTSSTTVNFDTRMASSLPFAVTTPMTTPQPLHQASIAPLRSNLFSQAGPLGRSLGNFGPLDIGLHNSPACEEGEIPESELDPDTRRRLLILQHGKDTRENIPSEPLFSVRPTVQAPVGGPSPGSASFPGPVLGPVSWVQSRENWFSVEEHTSTGRLSRLGTTEFPIPPDALIEKQHLPVSFPRKLDSSVWSDRTFIEKQRLPREASCRDDKLRSNYLLPNYQSFQGNGSTLNQSASRNKDFEVESERSSSLSRCFLGALHDIAVKCKTKVEFKSGLVASQELKFSMEAYFSGEKIGEGTGLCRREAKQRAAEAAMMSLAERYLVYANSDTNAPQSDTSRGQSASDVRFLCDTNSHVDCPSRIQETVAPSSEPTRLDDSHVDGSKKSGVSTSVLKELCMKEDLTVNSKDQSPTSTNPVVIDQIHAEVEVNGQVVGEVTGSSSDEANLQAAEPALASLKSMLGQFTKHPRSPRSVEGMPNKRLKQSIHGV